MQLGNLSTDGCKSPFFYKNKPIIPKIKNNKLNINNRMLSITSNSLKPFIIIIINNIIEETKDKVLNIIEIIRRDIQIRKTSKIMDEAADKFMKKIDDAVIECITKDNKTKKVNKATTQENNNYNDMSVI